MKRLRTVLLVAIGLIAMITLSPVGAARPIRDGGGEWVQLTVRLPAIGNTRAVREWQYGRIQSIGRAGQDDTVLDIRGGWGQQVRVVCPRGPFIDLCRASSWMDANKQAPSGPDVVERMIAYDADESGRIIALVSLEPIPRNAKRIARSF